MIIIALCSLSLIKVSKKSASCVADNNFIVNELYIIAYFMFNRFRRKVFTFVETNFHCFLELFVLSIHIFVPSDRLLHITTIDTALRVLRQGDRNCCLQ